MPRFTIVVLIGLMLSLDAAAHASPPDETWIAGVYDNADFDDVVRAITSSVASLQLPVGAPPTRRECPAAVVLRSDDRTHDPGAGCSNHVRPPPAR